MLHFKKKIKKYFFSLVREKIQTFLSRYLWGLLAMTIRVFEGALVSATHSRLQ